ncbi:MAG: bifunctional DNA-formamidopyrimidine glycosylase/DNA-(apurinic or apyrimidinic site) lyase [Burkholderiales bacterium]
MPELPEVEITRLGLLPHARGRRIVNLIIRQPRLRWPVPDNLAELTRNQRIAELERRGKYLLVHLERGKIIIHLGMSGSLRIIDSRTPAGIHDHVDIVLDNNSCIRLRDPRRFGAVLWSEPDIVHPLLARLGIEPLSDEFDGKYLHELTRNRRNGIKVFLMDSQHIVGIGNIYANESLFHAGIHPELATGKLSRSRCILLVQAVRDTLNKSIAAGGSSLRDFTGSDGSPGYFQQHYFVYGRADEACLRCGNPVRLLRQQQRATYFCPHCQKK